MPKASPGDALILSAGKVSIAETSLPVLNRHFLKKGDEVLYVLPSGRHLHWVVEADRFSAEQTTTSGIKGDIIAPEFEELKHYGVTTSSHEEVSAYYFDIDGYRINWVEDLRADRGLPVIITVRKAGPEAEDVDTTAFRRRFDTEYPPATGPSLRVPIATVHHELVNKMGYQSGLTVINGDFAFELSGDITAMTEDDRRKSLEKLVQYVADHLERVERISSFGINIRDGNRVAVRRYVAVQTATGKWEIREQP